MNTKQVAEKLGIGNPGDSGKCLSVRKGVYKLKVSYYWGFTKSGDTLKPKVEKAFPNHNVEVVNYGNHFAQFDGRAKSGSAKDSYLWIEFKLVDKPAVV